MTSSIYEVEVETLAGEQLRLADYRGQVLLVVNTASKCGFTPQYEGLESLHRRYAGRGLVVLGFPCNQFGGQEPGTREEIAGFCRDNYRVSFPMHAKVDVNGPNTHALYRFLKPRARGLLGSQRIKWNFTKFLVDRRGNVVGRYASMRTPASLVQRIDALLESDGSASTPGSA